MLFVGVAFIVTFGDTLGFVMFLRRTLDAVYKILLPYRKLNKWTVILIKFAEAILKQIKSEMQVLIEWSRRFYNLIYLHCIHHRNTFAE